MVIKVLVVEKEEEVIKEEEEVINEDMENIQKLNVLIVKNMDIKVLSLIYLMEKNCYKCGISGYISKD